MTATDLALYVELLESLEMQPDLTKALAQLQGIMHSVRVHPVQIESYTQELGHDIQNLQNNLNKFVATMQGLKDNARTKLANMYPKLYADSHDLYVKDMVHESSQYIQNRKLESEIDGRHHIESAIKKYTDWRLPGMCIRPGSESFVDHMVSLYPLYVVDTKQELIDLAVAKWPEKFQNRLCPYLINDYRDHEPLHAMPDNQFGLILVYNFFNYRPLDIIARYMTDFYKKLRPGGHVIFTFNDCDTAHGIGLAERKFMCFTPGSMIQQLVIKAGLEIVEKQREACSLAWMDIKKPGAIESIKGGQTLAKIMYE